MRSFYLYYHTETVPFGRIKIACSSYPHTLVLRVRYFDLPPYAGREEKRREEKRREKEQR
jgi:hypothetical protein